MRKIFCVLYAVAILCACTPAVQQTAPTYQTVIIWYDSKAPLLERIQAENAEIIYDYQNFNGMALRIPVCGTLEQTQQSWASIPGVLSVQPDQLIHLDNRPIEQ